MFVTGEGFTGERFSLDGVIIKHNTIKTQATPAREIAITEKRKHEYEKQSRK
jgi:hypothetical protein